MTPHNHQERMIELPQATLARYDMLDDLSRTRALTDDESLDLERCMERLIYGPPFPGSDIALARRDLLQARRRRSRA